MTISSEIRKAGPFAGNDVTTSFPFLFRVFSESDVVVVFTDESNVESTLVMGTDYTVTLNANQDTSPGGSVVLPAALATGDKLTLTSDIEAIQPTDLTNNGGFYPSVITRALDRLTIIAQQLKEQMGRSVKVGISESRTPEQLVEDLFDAEDAAASSATGAAASAAAANTSAISAATSAALADSAGNASAAQDAKEAAEQAASVAQAARDAAAVNADVYASTSAGLAGTSVGDQFQVVSGLTINRYRHDAGPTATLVATYPASDSVAELRAMVIKDNPGDLQPWQVTDEAGRAALAIDESGQVLAGKLSATTATIGTADVTKLQIGDGSFDPSSEPEYSITDQAGRVALQIMEDGTVAISRLVVDELVGVDLAAPAPPAAPSATWHADINHIIGYGQSLSIGQTSGAVVTTTGIDGALRFVGGARAWDGGTNPAVTHASLAPLLETISGTLGETPSSGTAQSAIDLIAAENGLDPADHSYQLLLSCPGEGGKSVVQLSKGTAYYTRLLLDVAQGYTRAQAAGKFYAVNAMTWTQGEADTAQETDPATYRAGVSQLLADVTADAKAVTGQAHSPRLITYQMGSHGKYAADGVETAADAPIALAHLKLHEDGVSTLACPAYQFDYLSATNVHLTAESSKWLGAYYGLAYKRTVIDGEDFSPLRPLAAIRQGRVIRVTMHVPVAPLVIDTTWVAANNNHGFEVLDSTGTAIPISSVTLGADSVTVATSADIPSGSVLRYALTAGAAGGQLGRTTGPRGNLRDSQGDTLVFDPAGINRPMHNWCVMFSIAI